MTLILTPALIDELTDALNEAMADETHGDHAGYLETLAATPNGAIIDEHHALMDVIEYFGIEID